MIINNFIVMKSQNMRRIYLSIELIVNSKERSAKIKQKMSLEITPLYIYWSQSYAYIYIVVYSFPIFTSFA